MAVSPPQDKQMFIALYKWRIDPEKEEDFIDAWSAITRYYRTNYHSSGSRLHKGSDGLFYGYAQWKTEELRMRAFLAKGAEIADAGERMKNAIEERFPEVVLETVADYIV